MLISLRKSGKNQKNKAVMKILRKEAAKNASKGLALDKPAFQNRVASKRPTKEIIRGFKKYCRGMARRYLSNPMLTPANSDTSTGAPAPSAWYWDFGDGYTSTYQNPSHQYAASGVYTVSHSATNTQGSAWLNKTAYITIT